MEIRITRYKKLDGHMGREYFKSLSNKIFCREDGTWYQTDLSGEPQEQLKVLAVEKINRDILLLHFNYK